MSEAAVALLVAAGLAVASAAASVVVYVGSAGCDGSDTGCVDNATAEQILHAFDVASDGKMTPRSQLARAIGGNPIWLATTPGCLFMTLPDTNTIQSFAVSSDGSIKGLVSNASSGGVNPVFAASTADARVLLVANYHGPDDANTSTGASAASLLIGEGCALELADSKPHNGSSAIPTRQGGAHVHSFVPARDRLAYACDLGMDIIFSYAVSSTGELSELQRTPTAAGSGPRHLVQHPSRPFIYVVSEMGMTVTAYEESGGGILKLLQTVRLVPDGASGEGSKAAEIAILPDGSALYATNRGNLNTVTNFEVRDDGTLRTQQRVDVPSYPRGMALTPDGSLLLVAGQSSNEVMSYRVGKAGFLETPGQTLPLGGAPPHPATFAFVPTWRTDQLV